MTPEERCLMQELERESCKPSPYWKSYAPSTEAADKRRYETFGETRSRLEKIKALSEFLAKRNIEEKRRA